VTKAVKQEAVVITGPTRGLGLATALNVARISPGTVLLLLGRAGSALDAAVAQVRAAGATDVVAVPLDQASQAAIRVAAEETQRIVRDRQLAVTALVANVGIQTAATTTMTRDGFEQTFGVNVLGTHLLVRLLEPVLAAGARVVLVGSGTAEDRRRDGLVPIPRWEDPMALAYPRSSDETPMAAGRRAYATSKLAMLYLAHAMARRSAYRFTVDVYDPGMLPGTSLARDASLAQRIAWQAMAPFARWIPGSSTPERSGRVLAALALGQRGANGDRYLSIDRDTDPTPTAFNQAREERLWEVAEQLTTASAPA
jgi:NAD(P)-dependent dehydrogenase (short-subunit alcohol dehydrogenase family)